MTSMSGNAQTAPHATRLVGILTVVSFAAHVMLHFVRRKIYVIGLNNVVGGKHVWGAPRDEGRVLGFLLAHTILLLVLFGAYAWIVDLCRRGRTDTFESRRILFVAPAVASVGSVLLRPYLSIDLCCYLMHGYIARSGGNPHVVPLYAVNNTPEAAELAPLGWRAVHGASPYGPLQTLLERTVTSIPGSPVTQMIAFKLVMVACLLATALFVWIALARRGRTERITAVVMLLWNPMVLVETGIEGHNDAYMAVFVVAAFAAAIHGRSLACVVALSLAVLTKYVPVLLVVPLGVYLWRTQGRSNARQLVRDVVAGGAISAVAAAALFSPYWEGGGAWKGVLAETQAYSYGNGVGRAAMTYLHAGDGVHTVLFAAVVAVMIFLSAKIRNEESLVFAALVTMCAYDFIASRRIFAWYGILPIALGAMLPTRRVLWLLVAVSLPMSTIAPLQPIFVNGSISSPGYVEAMVASQPFLGVLIPAIVFGAWLLRDMRRAAHG